MICYEFKNLKLHDKQQLGELVLLLLKIFLKQPPLELIAKTLQGLEPYLAKEIADLGGQDVKVLKRAVSFNASKELLYKVNYCSRLAIRVIQPIMKFEARNEDELYWAIYKFKWKNFLTNKQTFAIEANVYSDFFRHSKYVALKSKDAIADAFMDEFKARPSVDVENPDLLIDIHLTGATVVVSIDSSGESLHKRGYRSSTQHKAPLNEVLAAGLVLASGWDKSMPLIDPMCGSGTLLIEAAMMALRIPAAYLRKDFGFMHWNNFNAEQWAKVKAEADAQIEDHRLRILGTDIAGVAVDIAKEAVMNLRLTHAIKIEKMAFEDLETDWKNGMIMTNPPYGDRIEKKNIEEFYTMIGDLLKKRFAGYQAWIFSGNFDALKYIGLRASKKIVLHNGPIECKFQQYELFTGSKFRDNK